MPLLMPRPMKRSGTSHHQLVQRIPADVKAMVRGLRLAVPVGDEVVSLTISDKAHDVRLSLRTRDPLEAKARQAAAVAYLTGIWQSVREGPKGLTHRQIVALAGEAYRGLIETFGDDPGTAEVWVEETVANVRAEAGLDLEGRAGLRIDLEGTNRARSMALRFGPMVAYILAKHRLVVDDATRARLIEEVGKAIREAGEGLFRNAVGDYSPDTRTDRFPEWKPPQPETQEKAAPAPAQDGEAVKLTGLLEGWWREAKAAGRSISTHQSYSATVAKLVAFLKHDDARQVTPEDVVRFKDHRLAEVNSKTGKPASPKTVKDSDLAGLKAIFGWAVANKLISSNPAEGITIKLGKQKLTRSKGFTDAEAAAILKAATDRKRGQENPKTAAAKRWVPWLLAYSGARVGEMAQLRKQDVRCERDVWIVHVTPEAGTVKGGEYRDIPLHPHLVELGFPAFVSSAPEGHLFLTPSDNGDVLGPLQGVKNRLAEFARELVPDPRVAPNHGWRHRFKTLCRDSGVDPRVRDVIQGHASRTVADDYGDVTVKAMVLALEKLPRQGEPGNASAEAA